MTQKHLATPTDHELDDARWTALRNRDRSADGTFFYAVKSTGVYCRPSCGARLPLRENVAFYATADEAEAAGFRACKRCKPKEAGPSHETAARIAQACRLIEQSESSPSLEALAAATGLSPFHFHRVFKSVTGLTPKEYASAQRGARVRASLKQRPTVTEALYEAGFNSSSRFYEGAKEALGMKPGQYRRGGEDSEIFFAVGDCSLGAILAAQTERGVCAVLIGADAEQLVRELQDRFPKAKLIGDAAEYSQTVAKVVALVEKPSAGLDLPLDLRGTVFQKRVWQALQQIPPGTTTTYGDVAKRIGRPKAVRAVARACATNPVAVAIPCHRVVRTDGSMSGYRWGIDTKRTLLEREQRV